MAEGRRPPKSAKVKNKAPAPVQITAEQLLREAKERQLEVLPPPPKQKIIDPDELADLQLRKRKEYEDNIRKNRYNTGHWLKYAKYEESQLEIQRARSVFERALDVDSNNITIWLKYAEMEMRLKHINHARNLWDRAVTILPRVNQFWYKYTYMEEMLGNVASARQIFDRWMEWQPDEQAWFSYIKMELRYKEVNRARAIYERFICAHPDVKNWTRFARFEENYGSMTNARIVFERAIEFFGDENIDEKLIISFVRFEESCGELERVRVIFKYALDKLGRNKALDLVEEYSRFEKRHGYRDGIEQVIFNKRQNKYEEEVLNNPTNYDAWFDLLNLLKNNGVSSVDVVRNTFEKAISSVPTLKEKRHYRRYIYLWINYFLYEELVTKDLEKTSDLYRRCLEIIPHNIFTFAKIWLMYATFEIRSMNVQLARKILGNSIGKCPKEKLYREYIALELKLREFARCRKLYEAWLQFTPSNVRTWIQYSEMEELLGEIERSRTIYELAVEQPLLDMPEVLWKSYIDFEIKQQSWDCARNIFERLLERTQHIKVWLSYTQFETSTNEENKFELARRVYRRANNHFKDINAKEDRIMLLENWLEMEKTLVDSGKDSMTEVQKLLPKKVKKRRKITSIEGSEDAGWEEYYDYVFPDDTTVQPNLKLLQMAKIWKQQQAVAAANQSDQSSVIQHQPSYNPLLSFGKSNEDDDDGDII